MKESPAHPISVIKHLEDEIHYKPQPPLPHILLMQPNSNPTAQAQHVAIAHCELVLCNVRDKVRRIHGLPLQCHPPVPYTCSQGGWFFILQTNHVFPLLEMSCAHLVCIWPSLNLKDQLAHQRSLRTPPNPKPPLLLVEANQDSNHLLMRPLLLLVRKILLNKHPCLGHLCIWHSSHTVGLQ